MSDVKYAILGDVHSNWEALEAVLADAAEQSVTHYACVGDVIGYNASPAECLAKIREIKCTCVRGNHDHYCSHDEDLSKFHPMAAAVIEWTRHQLSDEEISWLKHLWYQKSLSNFALVHATLDMPEKWGYVFDDLDAMTHFNYQITPVCFHGHTHVPVVFKSSARVQTLPLDTITIERGHKYFINVGSVGQPRDGIPDAAYAIYDLGSRIVTLRRVQYDVGKAQARILSAGLPEWLAERLALGK